MFSLKYVLYLDLLITALSVILLREEIYLLRESNELPCLSSAFCIFNCILFTMYCGKLRA
jgi:hypothetical protein